MPSVFINFPKTEITFYLFDEEVDEKMAKKLAKLGLADLAVQFPENPSDIYVKGDDGLFHAGEFSNDSFPVTDVTDQSCYRTIFNREDNSVTVHLEGRFLCFNTLDDVEPIAEWKTGYVWGVRLKNDKGKVVTKPKDEWGMSTPIEALAEKGVYGGGAHQVLFSIHVEDETFYS
mgnify:CR=1 FL=1